MNARIRRRGRPLPRREEDEPEPEPEPREPTDYGAGPRTSVEAPDDPDFRRFAELIEAEGYKAKFEGIRYTYLRVDNFLYWTSRSLWTPGQNINRRPVSDVEGQPEHEQATLPI
jgi:hypothetical protein